MYNNIKVMARYKVITVVRTMAKSRAMLVVALWLKLEQQLKITPCLDLRQDNDNG